MSQPENGPFIPAIRWPVPKNNRGGDFSNLEEMLAHLEGEATGHWLIGRNGMWHGGIHITDTTTPWCALSGQAMNEAVDFPVPFQGEQAVRCMADGEMVAYRINRDYTVKVLTDTRWMHRVPAMVENQWHMHPLVFLDAIKCGG